MFFESPSSFAFEAFFSSSVRFQGDFGHNLTFSSFAEKVQRPFKNMPFGTRYTFQFHREFLLPAKTEQVPLEYRSNELHFFLIANNLEIPFQNQAATLWNLIKQRT